MPAGTIATVFSPPKPFTVDAASAGLSVDSLGRDYAGHGIPLGRGNPASSMQNVQKDRPGGGLIMGVTDPTLGALPVTLNSANWKALRVRLAHHFPGTLSLTVVGAASNSVAIYRVVNGVPTKTFTVALGLDQNIADEIFQIHTIPGFTSSVKITALFTFDSQYALPPNYPYDEVTVSPGGTVLGVVAQIPTTAALTPRLNLPTNPQPRTRPWPSRQFPAPGHQTSATWDSGDAIVLVQGSAASVPLVAYGDPSFISVKWTVQRNTADAAALPGLAAANLTVTPDDPTGQTARVSLDSTGSFSVVCYIDNLGWRTDRRRW